MRTPFRLRLAAKLGLAFAGVLAVMLASLVLVLQKSSEASHAYERAIAWKSAVEGAASQADGTRQQQAAQALFVATGEERYKLEWQAGVDASEKAGAAVEALHDPVVGKLAAGATGADQKHDATVNNEALPGDGARISAGTGRIQTEVGEVAAVAEQSSASAEEVTATTEETSASTQEIANSAEELAVTAERLDGLVGSFRF